VKTAYSWLSRIILNYIFFIAISVQPGMFSEIYSTVTVKRVVGLFIFVTGLSILAAMPISDPRER